MRVYCGIKKLYHYYCTILFDICTHIFLLLKCNIDFLVRFCLEKVAELCYNYPVN